MNELFFLDKDELFIGQREKKIEFSNFVEPETIFNPPVELEDIRESLVEEEEEVIIFEDDFTGEVKPEWNVIVGPWAHDSELDAYTVTYSLKGKTKVDIATPDDMLVEFKVIKLNTLKNTYFDLLARHTFSITPYHSGYSIAYIEVYSRLYDWALLLIRWDNSSRKGYLDYGITWADLGLSGVEDLEGKTIGIKCEGNVIKGYLDGVEILSATDDTYSSGQAGIIVSSGTEAFIFDDFKIK